MLSILYNVIILETSTIFYHDHMTIKLWLWYMIYDWFIIVVTILLYKILILTKRKIKINIKKRK